MRYVTRGFPLLAVVLLALLGGCGQGQERAAQWQPPQGIYATCIQYTQEDEGAAQYLEVAQRSKTLLALLEKEAGAFVVDAYNYMDADGSGTPVYQLNHLTYPAELDPYGLSLQVSPNYFQHNPIQTAEGAPVEDQIIWEENTRNLLVPEQYRGQEDVIRAAYLEDFYFRKVQAENDYNEMAGSSDRLTLTREDLTLRIIYVKDGQRYFTFRPDCAQETGGWVTDPIVAVYTDNLHCNYAHSFLSQWAYLPSQAGSAEGAYQEILPYVQAVGAQESLQKLAPLGG